MTSDWQKARSGVAVGQLEDVGLRTVADEADDVHARVVGGMLGQHGAEGVVRAGLTAGDEAKLRAVRGCGRRRGIGAGGVGGSGGIGRGGVAAAGDEAPAASGLQVRVQGSFSFFLSSCGIWAVVPLCFLYAILTHYSVICNRKYARNEIVFRNNFISNAEIDGCHAKMKER